MDRLVFATAIAKTLRICFPFDFASFFNLDLEFCLLVSGIWHSKSPPFINRQTREGKDSSF